MKLLTKGMSIFDRVLDFLALLGAIIIILIMIVVCIQVFMRYFLNSPLAWAIQFAEYGPYSIAFLAAAWILRSERHVKIDMVMNQLNPRGRAMLGIITSIIGAIICLILAIYGTQVVLDLFQRGIYEVKTIELPKAPILSIIPIGSLALFIQFLRRAYKNVQDWTAPSKKEERVDLTDRL